MMKINRFNLCSTLLVLLTSSGVVAFEIFEVGCEKSYFDIDVGIQPADAASLAACDAEGSQTLSDMIKEIIEKKFEQYVAEVTDLRAETLSEFCAAEESTRRYRRLTLQLGSGGFGYAGSSECMFCKRDDGDVWDLAPTAPVAGPTPIAAPSPSPSMAPSLGNGVRATDAEMELRTTLQRRIRRTLTQKVNHNVRRSCLVGSNSIVEVLLTPMGSSPPPMVCE